MKGSQKTKAQLIEELREVRRQLAALATSEAVLKRTEEELRESEGKYRTLVDNSIIGIMNVDLTGKITYVNKIILESTGYSWDELVGKNAFKLGLIPNDTLKILSMRMKEKLAGQPPGRLELQFKRKDGQWIWLQIRGSVLRKENTPVGFLLIGEDITAYKQAEEALKESEEKFAAAFRAGPEAMTITKLPDGTVLEANDSFTQVTGYTHDEIIGRSHKDINFWAKPGDRDKMFKRLQEKGRVSNEEYLLRTKRGELRNMLLSIEQINLGEKPCLLTVAIDITDFRKMEKQAREAENLRELDRLRTELLANISHELRTPLASIKGFATMLMEYEDKLKHGERHEYLEIIDNNTDRLVELIEQLLEMSRLEAGMLSIKKKPNNIIKLCREVIAEVRVRASSHRFTLDIPAKLPRISVDARRIRQILDNIIDNSVKFSEAGTEINLAVRQEGNELLFTITDHGAGIPQDDLPLVFKRMFHSSRKPGVSGAGLGLAICKGLTEAHNGRIWIESDEGIGTRCFFTLPLDTGDTEHT
jgi:PAS domain S-box-containing protein